MWGLLFAEGEARRWEVEPDWEERRAQELLDSAFGRLNEAGRALALDRAGVAFVHFEVWDALERQARDVLAERAPLPRPSASGS